jgi:transposase
MKRCPDCGYTRDYELADVRRKCRACGKRYSWTSVWDSVRLPGRVKSRLLKMFVLGVPVWRQRFVGQASPPSIERFYRACGAWEENLREPLLGALECDETTFGRARHDKRGWGAGKVIAFGVVKRNDCVTAMPIGAHNRAEVMRTILAHTREGSMYYTDEWQAYATLRTLGEHVMIRKGKGWSLGRDHVNGIEGFRRHAKSWPYPYCGVPAKYFHLYLAEVCWRFNHRNEDLKPFIKRLLTTLSTSESQQVFDRKA